VRHYLLLVRVQLRSQAQYRASIVLDLVAQILLMVLEIVTALAVLSITPVLGGFARGEALLITALAATAANLADMTVGGVLRLPGYVDTGRFDVLLLRPVSAYWHLAATGFQLRRIGSLAGAVVLLALASAGAVSYWTPEVVVMLIVAPLAGAATLGAITAVVATLSFRWTYSAELVTAVSLGGRDLGMYPQPVFEGIVLRLTANVLGFAFVAYYPALVILAKPDPLGAPDWTGWAAPAVASLFVLVATQVWRSGIRTYRSTGS
jgi:ABC-2 type transport system permease protein